MPPPRLLSYRGVCELLDCSDDTIRRLVKRGLLAGPKRYDGLGLRFEESDVLEYLYTQRAKQRVKPEGTAADSRRKPQIGPEGGEAAKP